jgi:hypothetical protein
LLQNSTVPPAHARTAAKHFEAREVPRGCAHIVAVEGHLLKARRMLDGVAEVHAAHAVP